MQDYSLKQLIQGLQDKQFSSVELTQHYLDQIKNYDPQLNSFITVTEDLALQQAKQADMARANGEFQPLTGIPIAHKDIFCTTGIKTSCGSKMLDNFVSPYESTVTQKLLDAGTVTLGKTNMDEFAMGSSNESSFYGPVHNPWQIGNTPGGSSGGSAAVVAAGLAPAATASDTGGSIRQPASFTGTTGLKPTYGRISRWGMIAFASSLDQAGTITKTAEDAAILLNVMAGKDSKDATSVDHPVDDYTAKLNDSMQGKVIGLPKEYFNQQLDDAITKAIDDAIDVYKGLGCQFKEISLPHTDKAISTYYVIAPCEASANLSRYDGVRYGHRCDQPKDIEDLFTRSRSEGFGDEVKRRIMIGTYALSTGFYDAYYVQAQKVRRLIQQDFLTAFESVDLILSPTTPTTAFELSKKNHSPVDMYLQDIYTIATNLAGLPAISVPCGQVSNLPVGLQLIAPHWQEAHLLNAAHQYQSETKWHLMTPSQINQGGQD